MIYLRHGAAPSSRLGVPGASQRGQQAGPRAADRVAEASRRVVGPRRDRDRGWTHGAHVATRELAAAPPDVTGRSALHQSEHVAIPARPRAED